MSWFVFAIAAYAIMAFSQVMDKVFLNKFFRDSRAYAVFVGLAGLVVFLALPLTKGVASIGLWIASLSAGALFIAALFPFLSALQDDEASRVIPLTGGIVPVATLALERAFMGVTLRPTAYLGVGFLVLGAVVFTASRRLPPRRSGLAAVKSIAAALLFAASFVLSKYVYGLTDFWTGFVWMRAGGALAALLLLAASSDIRHEMGQVFSRTQAKGFMLYGANQILAAVGFALQNAAIYLSYASLVTAMQGVQYVFVIAFVLLFSRFQPALLQEKITKDVVLEKLTAVACLITGLALLAV